MYIVKIVPHILQQTLLMISLSIQTKFTSSLYPFLYQYVVQVKVKSV